MRRPLSAGVGTLLAVLMGSAAAAQEADPQGSIETVVVTAQKRPEDLQTVPISMTVLTASDISARGINDLRQLENSVPNLTFQGVDNSIDPEISIRGISSDARNIGFESGVSMYIDGVYTGRPDSFNLDMLDVDQIEVLRGPQGTLFGKNTTAGAINITTRQPTDTMQGDAELQYGSYNQVVARGSVSGPLDDDLFGEVGGFYRYHDGYEKNLFDNSRDYGESIGGGQAKLRLVANATTELTLALDGLAEHYRPDANELTPGSFGYVPGQSPRDVDIDAPVFQTRQVLGTSLTANIKLDDALTLTSISAYRIVDTHFLADDDGTPLPFLTSDFADNENQFSQEVRIASPADDRLSYVVGLFFYDQTVGTDRASVIPPNTLVGPTGIAVTLTGHVATQSYAAFGQADYKITDALTLTAGGRYTYESKDVNMDLVGSPVFGIISLNTRQSLTDSNFSPMVNLSYRFNDDVNAYAKISQGFKSGGFNVDFVGASQIEFKPETVTDYEIGVKTQVTDKVRLDTAAFYMDYSNLQVESFEQLSGFVISNAATAHIWGFELDGVADLFPGFELSGGFGYLNATFSSYLNGGGLGINYTGNELPDAPHWTANIAGEYKVQLAKLGTGYVRGEYAYRDHFFTDADNASTNAIGGYGLVDARIGLVSQDGHWTFEIWGKNLGDKLYADDRGIPILGGLLGQNFVSYGAPRTFGLRVATQF